MDCRTEIAVPHSVDKVQRLVSHRVAIVDSTFRELLRPRHIWSLMRKPHFILISKQFHRHLVYDSLVCSRMTFDKRTFRANSLRTPVEMHPQPPRFYLQMDKKYWNLIIKPQTIILHSYSMEHAKKCNWPCETRKFWEPRSSLYLTTSVYIFFLSPIIRRWIRASRKLLQKVFFDTLRYLTTLWSRPTDPRLFVFAYTHVSTRIHE